VQNRYDGVVVVQHEGAVWLRLTFGAPFSLPKNKQ
jgi:hypothetical protein